MGAIADALRQVRARIPEHVSLVAVSKYHPVDAVDAAYRAGQRIFGESRVQELAVKAEALPRDIRWHFIGHLQTNKVRRLLQLRPALIESVDSARLLDAIDAESCRQGIVTRVLLQLHVAREETKFGMTPDEALAFFANRSFEALKATHICGLMAMASNTDDAARVRADFDTAAATFRTIKDTTPDLRGFDILSMGMSHDFPQAIEAGANMVRVGSAIFGEKE